MKIRNGFVSNSSSSSFIVAVDHPGWTFTHDSVKKAFYGDRTKPISASFGDETVSIDDAVNKILPQLSSDENRLLTFGALFDKFEEAAAFELENREVYPGVYTSTCGVDERLTENHYELVRLRAFERCNDFWKAHHSNLFTKEKDEKAERKIFILHFSDNTDGEAVLEHGDTFANCLEYVRISEH
jgi:hypothetical protein